jgi:hypothetical protein
MMEMKNKKIGKNRQVSRKEACDAFRRIKGMNESLDRRRERDYDRSFDPYNRYNEEGLIEMIKEEDNKLTLFWIDNDYRNLFEFSHYWSENHTAICNRDTGSAPYYPNIHVMNLLLNLSEKDEFDSNSTKQTFSAMFFEEQVQNRKDCVNLIEMLLPPALSRLVRSLEGEQLANLLSAVNGYEVRRELNEKIAQTFDEKEIEKLGNHLAVTPYSSCIISYLKEAGEKGREVAEKIIEQLQKISKWLNETLDSATGEEHD